MRIITKKKQNDIAKRLAAIYYTAIHWQDDKWEDFVKCICGNVADIAFDIGGEKLMAIGIPSLVMNLSERLKSKETNNGE